MKRLKRQSASVTKLHAAAVAARSVRFARSEFMGGSYNLSGGQGFRVEDLEFRLPPSKLTFQLAHCPNSEPTQTVKKSAPHLTPDPDLRTQDRILRTDHHIREH